jgi:hypothetical protein
LVSPQAQNFFARRWRGEVPIRIVLWRDMLGTGTAVNILATFTALVAASQGASNWVVAAIHFTPLPYNIFLFAAINRAKRQSGFAVAAALAWLAVMTVV